MTAKRNKKVCQDLQKGHFSGLEGGELLEQVVACFGRDLEQFARFRCGGRSESEDVYQEALLAALRYLQRFRGDASVKTWLFKIASSACTKMRRGAKNRGELHQEYRPEDHQPQETDDIDPETKLLVWHKFDHLSEALKTLSDEDRTLLVKHEGEETPLKEISEQTGLSVSAIKSRLFRSRKRLRQELKKRGFEY